MSASAWCQSIDLDQIAQVYLEQKAERPVFNFWIKDYQIPIKGSSDRKVRYFKEEWIEKVKVVSVPLGPFDTGYSKDEVLILIRFQKKAWKKLPKRFRERIEKRNDRIWKI